MSHSSPRLLSCRPSGQRSHARQVLGCLGQQKELVDALQASIHRLPNSPDCLAPTKHLLNAFAFALTDRVAGPPCRSSVDGGAACASDVLRHVRRDIVRATRCHEARGVVVFISAYGNGRASESRG